MGEAVAKSDLLSFGRKVIYTDEAAITSANVVDVVDAAMLVHTINAYDCDYLWEYYKGNQKILLREKSVRPEICNNIVENHADEIVAFKTGYLMGEPVQYVGRGDAPADGIRVLNDYIFAEGKHAKDKSLAEWMHICGTGYRVVLPRKDGTDENDAPFSIFTADPRTTFVVYSSELGHEPMLAVTYKITEFGDRIFTAYTDREFFRIENGNITEHKLHGLGHVPVIEYPLNEARLGAFETVLPLLDAINVIDSNAVDDVEQTVQSLLLFHNVDIDSGKFDQIRERGGYAFSDIDPSMVGEVKFISNPLQAGQWDTIHDYLYDSVLVICGMPNRNGGSSTSDTGAAVIMRDGWSAAEARAKDTEMMFRESERRFLKILFKICKYRKRLNLSVADVEIRFTRRNYENILQKAQVLDMMLNNPRIAPKLAFEHCGMFPDPGLALKASEEAYEKYKADPFNATRDRAAPQTREPGGAGGREGRDSGSGD